MKLGNLKNFSLKKKESEADPEEVLIEGTTAEQIAEMKQKLAGRTRDLETAKTRISGLSRPVEDDEDDDDDDERIGPHPPLQELTLEDIDEDDDEDFILAPDPANPPVKTVNLAASETKDAEEDEDEESEEDEDESGDGDDLKNLFSEDEEEDNPLANLINFLPDVSVQELVDDIDEIKSIIEEWQQQR